MAARKAGKAAPAPKKAAAKPAKARLPRAAPAVRVRPKPQHVERRRKPAAPAREEESHDYLVVYEEPDPYGLPADDALVLDIDAVMPQRGAVDVQQKVALELTNTTSRLGTFGFATACLGALTALAVLVTFALVYPEQWYASSGAIRQTALVKSILLLAIVSLLLMVAGTVLTHYGRRIQARGNLSDVRLVEKEPTSTATLG